MKCEIRGILIGGHCNVQARHKERTHLHILSMGYYCVFFSNEGSGYILIAPTLISMSNAV